MQVYILEADLMGRTVAFKNMNGELVAIAAKSTKALILSQVRPRCAFLQPMLWALDAARNT